VKALGDAIRSEVGKAVVGLDDAVELMLVALFSSGHILLEGPPGTAKTFLAQCFARAAGLDYGRIQFTPDLLPGDIIGSNLFNFQTSSFTLTRGPIFTELLLADEINRTPPKTQAALLEAMQERTVTIDGVDHQAQRPLHGRRDAEPDRESGRLSAARSAARSLPVQVRRSAIPRWRRSARSLRPWQSLRHAASQRIGA
jgi:MoxR-like ATPase